MCGGGRAAEKVQNNRISVGSQLNELFDKAHRLWIVKQSLSVKELFQKLSTVCGGFYVVPPSFCHLAPFHCFP